MFPCKDKQGQCLDAVAKMKDSVSHTYIHGQHYVCHPNGPRPRHSLMKPDRVKALGRPFQKTTGLTAQLIREFRAPAGVKVAMRFDAYYLCSTVVKACPQQGSTLRPHSKQLWRRMRTM